MGGMHFPSQLTEEEEILQQKYAKLKKKKKALAVLRAPKLEKQESTSDSLKRPADEDAADATEQAKKLLKSGALKLASERKEQATFKRSKRTKDNDNKSAVSFHPFSHGDGSEGSNRFEGSRPKPKYNLYDNFVSANTPKYEESKESTESPKTNEPPSFNPSKKGQTIYVHGPGLTEEILKKACASFGTIVNISPEFEKHCGFVTFEKIESAEQAIDKLNGSIVCNVQLRVSLARRQPNIDALAVSDQSKTSWSSIAASSSQKGNLKDVRDLVTYDDDDIF